MNVWRVVKGCAVGLCLILVAGCGPGGSGRLSGKIQFQPWTFVAGQADVYPTDVGHYRFVTLYSAAFTPCDLPPSTRTVRFWNVPMTAASYDLNANFTADFSAADDFSVPAGRLVIESITSTTVTGTLNVNADEATYLNGEFDAAICMH